MTHPAIINALPSYTGRAHADTIKIKVDGCAAIYLHVDRRKNQPLRYALSLPGKFEDSAMGDLLNKLVEEINRELLK